MKIRVRSSNAWSILHDMDRNGYSPWDMNRSGQTHTKLEVLISSQELLSPLTSNCISIYKVMNITIIIVTANRYLRQSTVHAAHWFVVQTLRAVHHNDIIAKCFAQIFDSLSFSCTSRSFRTTATVKMKCSRQSHVTSIQWAITNKEHSRLWCAV